MSNSHSKYGGYGSNRGAERMSPYAPGGELPPLGSGRRIDWEAEARRLRSTSKDVERDSSQRSGQSKA